MSPATLRRRARPALPHPTRAAGRRPWRTTETPDGAARRPRSGARLDRSQARSLRAMWVGPEAEPRPERDRRDAKEGEQRDEREERRPSRVGEVAGAGGRVQQDVCKAKDAEADQSDPDDAVPLQHRLTR